MYTIRATAKLRKRVGVDPVESPVEAATRLGDWYATTLPWRSPVALFVNETTLLPVLVALAPAKTVTERFPLALGEVMARIGAPGWFRDAERSAMADVLWAKTANRSVVGSMNEFAFLADRYRDQRRLESSDLVELSVRLARTPCSPLYGTHTSPDRALLALSNDAEHRDP